jgi:hypothetical protein
MPQLKRWLIQQLEKLLLMPDYIRAIAREFNNILFGETLVGLAFLLWWALSNPSNTKLIVVFVAAMFMAGYYTWRVDHLRLIPQFRIDGVHFQPTPTIDKSTGKSWKTLYVQIQPRCSSDLAITGCLGHLLRVDTWIVGRWINTGINEAMLLGWSYGSDKPITLYPGAENRLNLFLVHDIDPVVSPCVPLGLPLRAIDAFREAKKGDAFRFDVKITAENSMSVDVSLKVMLTDNPFHPDIEMLNGGQLNEGWRTIRVSEV